MNIAITLQETLNRAAFERRRFRRLKKAVQAELRVQGSDTPIRAETTDISEGGCYIEMAVTLDLGAPVKLILWLGHKKLELNAKVVTRHPQFGNGIEFGQMSEVSQRLLHAFLESADVSTKDCEVPELPKGLIV